MSVAGFEQTEFLTVPRPYRNAPEVRASSRVRVARGEVLRWPCGFRHCDALRAAPLGIGPDHRRWAVGFD